MSKSHTRSSSFIAAIAASFLTISAAAAASPTTASPTLAGQISVSQVIELLDRAQGDPAAQRFLTAYLTGLGEAVGSLVASEGVRCRTSMNQSSASVRNALSNGGGANPAATAATPILVQDILARAGCSR